MSVDPYRAFYVGGRYVALDSGERIMVGQMHVRRFGDLGSPHLPVVLLPGGAQTGVHYEQTPDGRPGFAEHLADSGRAVYVVDLPGIGRSRYYEPEHGPLTHYTAELMEKVFTATAIHRMWPGAELHTQWPGTGQVGDPTFDVFFASQVGHVATYETMEAATRAAGAALVDTIGPCQLITHSQSALYGWHIADERPAQVRAIIALEPKGPPYFEIRTGR